MKILITGALSGLGYSYAKALAKRGHIVYVGIKKEEEMLSFERKIREENVILFPLVLDLTKEDTYPNFFDLSIDCLILQASIGEGGSLLELDKSRLEENYKVNVFGNFSLLQSYLRYCYQTKKRGKIFLTSSLAAFLPLPYLGSYTSSKVSLYQLAKTLRYELKYQGLKVSISVLLPGSYDTGFNELMVINKEKSPYIMMEKAKKMTKYQMIFFTLSNQRDYKSLTTYLVREVEKEKPKFFISAPISQKIFVKLYVILSFLCSL